MMNTATITAGQAARAMGLDEKGMMALLSESGVQTEGGLLTGADTEALLSFLEGRQEDSRRKAQENLERLAARYTFLIDTCSLLNEQFPTLMEHLTPLLRVNGKRLFVPSSVLAELRSLLTKKPELRERITAAVKILAERKAEGTAVICGEAEASFADRQLLEVATRFMTSTELLVITQDDGLSNDLLGLNRLQSVQGKRLTVGRINRYGYLSRYLTQEQRFAGSSSRSGLGVALRGGADPRGPNADSGCRTFPQVARPCSAARRSALARSSPPAERAASTILATGRSPRSTTAAS